MDDDMDDEEMDEDEENFMALYEESFKRFEEGEVVTGKIIQIDKDYVLVDIGYKSEGLIPIREFTEPDGTVAAEVGDEVEVMVERLTVKTKASWFPRKKASKIKVWEEIKVAYEEEGIVEGTITIGSRAVFPWISECRPFYPDLR